MAEPARCPRCCHENPAENRFCGWCGASLESSNDLVPRREETLRALGHALPVKPGFVGKALAVGLDTLAMRAGMSWLRHRITADDRSSMLTTREHNTAVSERLLGQGLGEVLIQKLEEDYRSRTARQAMVRSIVVTKWTSSSRRSAGRPRGPRSSGSSRASSPPFEPDR